MRAKLYHLLSMAPLLVEYTIPVEEDDEDVDTYQFRKVSNFKRMMLEAEPSTIGIPIPIGYSDIYVS